MKKIEKLYRWVEEGKYLLLIIILLIGVSFVQYIEIGLDPIYNLKIYGLILQIIGAYTIINSLRNKLMLFKGHGLIYLFLGWFKRFPFYKQKKFYNLEVHLQESPNSISSKIKESIKIEDKNNPEHIVRYIDEKIEELKERVIKIENELPFEINEIKNNLNHKSSILEERIKITNTKIENSALSNVWLEFFGVACIIMGLFFSTIPELIIKLVQ